MTYQTEPYGPPPTHAQPPAPKSRRGLWIALAAALVLAIGVGSYFAFGRSGPLDGDPGAKKACETLANWLKGDFKDPDTGRPVLRAYVAMMAAEDLATSEDPRMRALAGEDFMDTSTGQLLKANGGPASFRVADLQAVHTACSTSGLKMPAYSPPN